MSDLFIDPGDIVHGLVHRGTVHLGARAQLIEPYIDADGGLYCIKVLQEPIFEFWRGKSAASIAKKFLHLANRIVNPVCRGATNKAILSCWTEIAGGSFFDLGNDAIASAGPTWAHGLMAPMLINRLGLRSLAPDGHPDGIQPWAPTLIEGAVRIDTRSFGEGYEEKGAGIYIEPDFGQNGPIIVRNGVSIQTRHGYCIQVVPKSGTGPQAGLEPFPVSIRGCYLGREDGKHPVNIAVASTIFEDNRTLEGLRIGRVPA